MNFLIWVLSSGLMLFTSSGCDAVDCKVHHLQSCLQKPAGGIFFASEASHYSQSVRYAYPLKANWGTRL